MNFVCPLCRRRVVQHPGHYHCAKCPRDFPIIAGIPDFRIYPDPYIGIEDDRGKAQRLLENAHSGFESLLRYYYSITPEVPDSMAARWIAHARAEPEIARLTFENGGIRGGIENWLDVGCGSGGLLLAAQSLAANLTGVDVALRWLVIAGVRLAEAGVQVNLVCANAEALPFPDESFHLVTAIDLLEHLRDAPAAVAESRRVLCPGCGGFWATNNRFLLLPEPHTRLWWTSWLPRTWQPRYVALRRPAMLPYRVCLRSARELRALFRDGGFSNVLVEAAPLFAPHRRRLAELLAMYNRFCKVPVAATVIRAAGPRLQVRAARPRE